MKSPIPILFVAAWLVASGSTWAWLGRRWFETDGGLHLLVALLLVGWVVRDLDARAMWERLWSARPRRGTLAWIVLPIVLSTAVYRVAPANTVLAMGTVASAYGVVGLFLSPERHRAARGLVLLALGALPLSGHLDVLLGFPLRQLTASVVASLLGAQLDAATVLAVEGGAAHVDIPCAGVRSLWSGFVVLAMAGVVWRRPVGVRWLVALGSTTLLLLLGNTARVAVLVLAHHHLGAPVLEEVLHVPLGVAVFVGALLPGLLVLRAPHPEPPRQPAAGIPQAWLGVAASIVLVCPLLQVAPHTSAAPPIDPLAFASLPVSEAEAAHAQRQDARITKVRLAPPLSGSAVFVASGNWRAHHVPTQCHESAGWSLEADRIETVGGTSVRWAHATRAGREATVFWWFQRAGHQTYDHTERIAAGLFDDATWVLVSVRVDGRPAPTDPAITALVDSLGSVAETTLETS